MKGGGSTAIATANAWISLGGNIQAINGRRPLPDDILDKCSSELEPDLFIDFDNSSDSESLVLFPKYTSDLVSSPLKKGGPMFSGRKVPFIISILLAVIILCLLGPFFKSSCSQSCQLVLKIRSIFLFK